MKQLSLDNLIIQELNLIEMKETNGGFLPLLVVAAAVLLSGCTVNINYGDGNSINSTNSVSADSTANGNTAGQGNGNKI